MEVEIRDIDIFESIFATISEGILVVDDRGLILKANPAVEKMFGYDKGELKFKKVETLISKNLTSKHEQHRNNYFQDPKSRPLGYGLDLKGIKKDNTEIHVEISLNPTKIENRLVTIALVVDISQRVLLQKSLLDNEQKLLEVQKLAGIGSWHWDLQTNKRSWSDQFYAIYGLTAGDKRLNSETISDFIHPQDRKEALQQVEEAIANRKSYAIEKRIIGYDKKIRHTISKGGAVYDEAGIPTQRFGTIQDISERKQLDIDLKAYEEKNKAILQAIPDVLFIQDYFGNIIEIYNEKSSKSFAPRDRIIGKNMRQFLPARIYKIISKIQKQTIKTKKVHVAEYSFKGKNGIEFVEARVVPLKNENLLTIVRDITEKKKVEESLHIKNKALEAAGNSIVIVDATLSNLPIIYCNNTFVKITGYSKEEVLGRNCRFLQNDDRNQEADKALTSALDNGKPCKVTLRNYRKNGALFWNELTITPVYNNKGGLTHFIGVHNDITVRKKEEFLKDQIRIVLEMIAKHQPLQIVGDLIAKIAEENLKNSFVSILLLNKKTETLHHFTEVNLPKSFKNALEGLSINAFDCSCTRAIQDKKEIIVENILNDSRWSAFNKKVKHPFISSWSFPILSSEKEVLGTFSVYFTYPKVPLPFELLIVNDLLQLLSLAIEQYNTNEMLQGSREQLQKYTLKLEEEVRFRTDELMSTVRKLVESNLNLEDQIKETKQAKNKALSNQDMFLAIAKNFPGGAITVINNDLTIGFIEGRELANYGIDRTNLAGLSIDEIALLNAEQKQGIKKNILKTLEGEHLNYEIEFKKNTYVVNTTPLNSIDEEIQQALFVFSNITEQKKIELDILEALRKEQELNELKSRFISLASHEFRTPLSAILSSANLIGKQPNDHVERRKKYVEIIKSNVKSLVSVLNDFLSLSRLEEGKVMSEPFQFDIIAYSKSIIEEIEPNNKEGQIIKMHHDDASLEVFIDPKIVRNVLTNLVSNATKYSNPNTVIKITFKKSQKSIYLEVTDQGIGIPFEEQNNLFNRFFRAKNAVNINGIGLGLYIVKQYIELIGGSITFESQLNQGTTFFVKLPLNQSKS